MIKIGFFGTPELSARVLEGLFLDGRFSVEFVVTNPDKAIGRKQILTPTPVKTLAESHNLPVFTPVKIRNNNEEFLQTITSYDCDYFVVVAYGKILPKEILDMPKKMCINVHGSILPKYRGASPIQSALLYGEKETGVTIMQMTEGMDEGAMILVQKITIDPNETSETLFHKFEKVSPSALIEGIIGLDGGELLPIEQNHNEATYCTKIEKEHGKIDWKDSAENIFHKYQAYTPWPGVFTFFHDKRLLLEKIAFSMEQSNHSPGTVFLDDNQQLAIACESGVIFPRVVKLEGKKSQNIEDFIRGNNQFLDTIL